MTDYTPEQAAEVNIAMGKAARNLSPAEKSLKFTDLKFADLVRVASRLKKERDELLGALVGLLEACDNYAPYLDEEFIAPIDKARTIIAKVEK